MVFACLCSPTIFLLLFFVLFFFAANFRLLKGSRVSAGVAALPGAPSRSHLVQIVSTLPFPNSSCYYFFPPELSSFIFPLKGRTTRVRVIHLRGGAAAAFYFFPFLFFPPKWFFRAASVFKATGEEKYSMARERGRRKGKKRKVNPVSKQQVDELKHSITSSTVLSTGSGR